MKNAFAERLKLALQLRGIRQVDLARKLKVNKSLITLYISGSCEPKTRLLFAIADLLDVNPKWLIGYDDQMVDERK